MKRLIKIVFVIFFIISLIGNGFCAILIQDVLDPEIKYSYDKKYMSTISRNDLFFSIHILGELTDKSISGLFDYCDSEEYDRHFVVDTYWAKDSHDLFVLSSDTGIKCIHHNSEDDLWIECNCDLDVSNNCLQLFDKESKQFVCELDKACVPEQVWQYMVKWLA